MSEAIQTLGANAVLTNSGSISTNGDDAFGIISSVDADNATITNSGSISTMGTDSDGILSQGNDAVVTNSGSISVTGLNAIGVNLDGPGPTGVIGDDDNTLTNSGLISATGSATQAIVGGTGMQTVNLEQGSIIIGTVDLGGGIDTVNINGTGPSTVVTFLGTENINLADDVPGVVVGNTVTTVDPTGQTIQSVAVSELTSSIHTTIHGRANGPSASASSTPIPASSFAAGAFSSLGDGTFGGGVEIWGEVFGNNVDREGESTILSFEQEAFGVVSGIETDLSVGRIGLAFGIASSDSQTDAESIDTETTSYFGGLYGHVDVATDLTLSANLILGYEDYDNDRLVADNLNGFETASADFSNVFISPSVSLEYQYEVAQGFYLRPSGSLTYTASFFDDYTETGTTRANLTIDSRTVHTLNTRIQLAGALVRDAIDVEVRGGFDGRFTDEDDVDASLAGNSFRFSGSDDESVLGGFIGLRAEMAANDQFSIIADGEYRAASGDEDAFSGSLQATFRF
ncbi:MAG: autotransporter outer membrane beta-barrel domain-containing protein [Pseudomonadota bacterium]